MAPGEAATHHSPRRGRVEVAESPRQRLSDAHQSHFACGHGEQAPAPFAFHSSAEEEHSTARRVEAEGWIVTTSDAGEVKKTSRGEMTKPSSGEIESEPACYPAGDWHRGREEESRRGTLGISLAGAGATVSAPARTRRKLSAAREQGWGRWREGRGPGSETPEPRCGNPPRPRCEAAYPWKMA